MAVLLTDTFDGADGTVWDTARWVMSRTPSSGGGLSQQAGYGRILTGTQGSYSSPDKIAVRANVPDPTDVEIMLDVCLVGEVYPQVFLRSNHTEDPGQQSYNLWLTNGTPTLYRSVGFVAAKVAAASSALSRDAWYRLRFRAVGSSIQARYWLRGTTEPATWNIADVTDTAIPGPGWVGVHVGGGGAAASQEFRVDNVAITDGASAGTSNVLTRLGGAWVPRRVRSGGAWINS